MMGQYDDLIEAAGKQYNVDPALIRNVIQTESSWNPKAVSEKGAVGLGQLIPATAKALGVTDPTDPKQAIPAVARLLDENLTRYGNVEDALRAYHGGTDQSNWGPKTQAYPGKVLGQSQSLPGIPQAPSGPSDDDIFAAFTGQQKASSDDDAIFNSFIKPDPTAKAGAAGPGAVTESRAPDGALVLEMGGTNQPEKSPFVAAIEKLGQFGRGAYQGLTDLPAGIGQSGAHQGQQILGGIDQLLGTNLAAKAALNVQALDAGARQREEDYQAATPGSVMAGVGRVAGNLAPAFIGGPTAAAAPLETLSTGAGSLAARLGAGPGMQGLARLLGAAGGGGLQGAAYGANTPVMVNQTPGNLSDLITGGASGNDYQQQARGNALTGLEFGGALPILGAGANAAGRTVGSGLRAMVDPFAQAGQQRIAENALARAAAGGPTAANLGQIVPGSVPTLAEATGNPGIATLQRSVRDLSPAPFVAQEQANAGARLNALSDMSGDASKLDFFRADREAVANNLYGKAIADYDASSVTPWIKGEITKLLKRPSVDKASRTAQRWAIERGEQPAPEGSLSALHDVKTAIDDMIGESVKAGRGGEAKALQATKDKLLTVMEKLSPEYADARITYAEMSKPINQMEVLQGLNLTDQMGNITLQKVQTAINGIQKRLAAPGIDAAKSLEGHQIATLEAIRDDLLRSKNVELGKSIGSATAQNLATQNMLSQVLPGKLGALAGKASPGTIGGGIGGLAGWMAAGPIGAPVGAMVGSAIGKTVSGAMNAQNEAIQGALQRMLLNAQSGAAALQRTSAAPAPVTQISGLQRLLYPALTSGGVGALSRPAPPR